MIKIRSVILLVFLLFSSNFHLNATEFIKDKIYSSKVIKFDAYVVSDSQDTVYSSYTASSTDIFQVYKKNTEGNYLLVQQLEKESVDNTYNRLFPNRLVIVQNALFVMGNSHVNIFDIASDGKISFREQVIAEQHLFGKLNWISDTRFFLHSNNQLSFWTVDAQGLNYDYSYEYPQVVMNATDVSLFDQNTNLVRVFRKQDNLLEVMDFSLDDTNKTLISANNRNVDIGSLNISNTVMMVKHDLASDVFFVKVADKEIFLRASSADITILSNNDVTASLAANAVRTHDKANSFMTFDHVTVTGKYNYIDWANLLVSSNILDVRKNSQYWAGSGTYFESFGTIGYFGPSAIMNMVISPALLVEVHNAGAVFGPVPVANVYKGENNLPNRVYDSIFEKNNNELIIAGRDQGDIDAFLYIWNYNSEINDFTHLHTAALPAAPEENNAFDFRVIGKYSNSYYVIKKTANSELLRFEIVGTELQLKQTVPLWLGGQSTHINQAFIIEDDIILSHHDAGNLTLTICDLTAVGETLNCEQKTMLQSYFNVIYGTINLFQLSQTNEFLIAHDMAHFGLADDALKWLVTQYNSATKDFIVTLEITPEASPTRSDYFPPVKNIFASQDGLNLYIMQEETQHYKRNTISSDYVYTGAAGTIYNSEKLSANEREDFFIIESGLSSYVLDKLNNKFYHAAFKPSSGDNKYELLQGESGYALLDSFNEFVELNSFNISNLKPAVYKGGLMPITLLQDEELNLDMRNYFVNGESVEVRNLPPGISLQYPYLKGALNNEAMFASADKSDPTLVSYYRIEFRLNETSQWMNEALVIYPVNVNDAPVLITPLPTQYFERGATYYMDFRDVISDPDRERVTFKFENVPGTASSSSEGTIQITISSDGTYTLRVIATDAAGASLTVEVTIIVNKKGKEPTKSSGGGGGSAIILLLLLGFASLRNKKAYS